MKKALSIFLLTVFLFDLFGYLPLFKYAQHKIQKEIKGLLKKSVPESELYVIAIPVEKVNDLDWKREGKEFRHNETMYDIVRYEKKGEIMHYHCVNDTQETQLFVHLEELVDRQMDNDKSPVGKTAKRIAKMFCALKYIPADNSLISPAINKSSISFHYSFPCTPVFLEVSTPPPNHFV